MFFHHCPSTSANQHPLLLCLIFNWAPHLLCHTCHLGLVSLARKQNMKGSAAVSLTLSKEQDCGVFPYSVFRDLHRWDLSYPQMQCWKHKPTPVQLTHLHKRKKQIVLKALRDIITITLSHCITSLLGGAAQWRPRAGSLGAAFTCSDNPRMLWLEQMVLCLALVSFRRSSEGNCPLKYLAQYGLYRNFLPFSSQEGPRG